MYIEFAGLPGSGKTTLSALLQKKMYMPSMQVMSRDEAIIQSLRRCNDSKALHLLKQLPSRLWRPLMEGKTALLNFSELSSNRLEFLTFFSETLAASELPELLVQSIWHTTVKTFHEVALISRHLGQNELALMDEAFFQRSFTLFGYMEKEVSNNLIERYAALSPISQHVILVITEPRTCVKRFMARYRTRPLPYDFTLDEKELLDNFQNGTRTINVLSRYLKKKGHTIWEINGQGDIEGTTRHLAKIANELAAKYNSLH